MLKLLLLSLAAIVLVGCDSGQQTTTETGADDAPIDLTRYIRAATLLEQMGTQGGPLIFDVRAEVSYQEAHIESALSMPYGKVEQSDLAAMSGVNLDSAIVTYCGCPHHLAGLAADQLIEWGYTNVRVLYEGFVWWRENDLPLAGLMQQPVTMLQFAGRVAEDAGPLASTDVFIRNVRNGQLEAAATDRDGRFHTEFPIIGYRPDDQFEVIVESLENAVVLRTDAQSGRANNLQVLVN